MYYKRALHIARCSSTSSHATAHNTAQQRAEQPTTACNNNATRTHAPTRIAPGTSRVVVSLRTQWVQAAAHNAQRARQHQPKTQNTAHKTPGLGARTGLRPPPPTKIAQAYGPRSIGMSNKKGGTGVRRLG